MKRLFLRYLTLLCVTAVLLSPATALAVPTVVPYAGYLTDAEGAPYEGTVDVHAALYPCATAGDGTCDASWTATTFAGVVISGGVLSFELGGEGTGEGDVDLAATLTESAELWLEIAVLPADADDWILFEGRHRLQAVPYAVAAHDADHLGGVEASQFITTAETTSLLEGYATENWVEAYTAATLSGDPDGEIPGYVTTVDLDDAITALGDLVDFTQLTSVLQNYLLESSLSATLAPYLLAANAYTDQDAIVAAQTLGYTTLAQVEDAGYVKEVNLPKSYTDADAIAAIEAEGYAKAADIPSHATSTAESTATVNHSGDSAGTKSTTVSFGVDAGIAKDHIRVDVQIRTELSVSHMVYSGTSPDSIAASVTHGVYLATGVPNAPLYTDRLVHSPPSFAGDTMGSGELKQYSYVLPLSASQLTGGTTVLVDLTASCATDDAGYSGAVGCSAFITLEQITITGF